MKIAMLLILFLANNGLADVDLPVQDETDFQPTNLVEDDMFDEDGNFVG